MPTATEMLNLDGVSGRAEKVRFDLYDRTGNLLGEVHPVYGTDISNTTEGAIKRTLNGWELTPDEEGDVNTFSDRVRPYWVLSDGTEYPLGHFLFADASNLRFSYGLHQRGVLMDQGLILAQPSTYTISFAAGIRVVDAIASTLALAGTFNMSIPSTSALLSSPVAWPAGDQTTFAKVLSELCVMGGFYDWYFSNTGVFTIREVTDPASVASSLAYLDGGRILDGSIIEMNDLLKAPNRYVVLDSSLTATAIVGTYDIPDAAPHSYANRNFRVPVFIDIPGIGSSNNAITAARSRYLQDVRAYETVQFSSPPDPRHDTFDVVNYRGTNYIELSWNLRCEAGGEMNHVLRRVYL